MMDETTVSPSEHGIVRVFLVDDQLRSDIGQTGGQTGTLEVICKAIGVSRLDGAHIQHLPTATLEDMSVADFLRQGYEVSAQDLAEHAFALDAVDDTDVLLLIVRSSAFLDRPATLVTDGAARLIATLREPGVDVSFDTLPNPDPAPAMQDAPQKKKPSDAAIGGRVATVVLLLMALLVWLMIWIAG